MSRAAEFGGSLQLRLKQTKYRQSGSNLYSITAMTEAELIAVTQPIMSPKSVTSAGEPNCRDTRFAVKL
jgi:hypothetical protein